MDDGFITPRLQLSDLKNGYGFAFAAKLVLPIQTPCLLSSLICILMKHFILVIIHDSCQSKFSQ